jgi:hypothetical protein
LFFETENGKGSIFDQTNQITIKSTTLNTDRFVMFCNYLKNESALKKQHSCAKIHQPSLRKNKIVKFCQFNQSIVENSTRRIMKTSSIK